MTWVLAFICNAYKSYNVIMGDTMNIDFSYRDNIINKLINGEKLDFKEIVIIEDLLTLDAFYDYILDERIGLSKDGGCKFIIKEND